MEERKSVSKNWYKIELLLIKFIPILISFINIIDLVFLYFKMQFPIFKYVGGMSCMTLIFLYVSSYVFSFCNYHRMFIHYLFISWIFGIINQYFGILNYYKNYCIIQFIIAGVSLFIILYLYVKTTKRTTTRKN